MTTLVSPGKEELRALYRRRAPRYDLTANLYYLIGFREQAYRRRAVAALGLRQGDTVIELGCGTGLNFPLLAAAVGPAGRIVGVDLCEAMLDQARARIQSARGWPKVDLVPQDMAVYAFPERADAILSSFALTLVPEFEAVIARVAAVLPAGRRFVVLDLKRSEWAPRWLVRFGVWLTSPFGVREEFTVRRPWEVMQRFFARTEIIPLYGGFAYIAVGEKKA